VSDDLTAADPTVRAHLSVSLSLSASLIAVDMFAVPADRGRRWVKLLDVEDPLVQKLSMITDKHAAARKKDVKNKWWYAMVHPTEARGKVVHH
jgi:hypothetical protein